MKSHKKINSFVKVKLKHWWGIYRMIEDEFWENIKETEKKMAKDTGIKDIEFFFNDGFAVGIGNSSRTIKLIQAEELESK